MPLIISVQKSFVEGIFNRLAISTVCACSARTRTKHIRIAEIPVKNAILIEYLWYLFSVWFRFSKNASIQ